MIEIRDDFLPTNVFEKLKKDIVYNKYKMIYINLKIKINLNKNLILKMDIF